jgi:hypothetical protein
MREILCEQILLATTNWNLLLRKDRATLLRHRSTFPLFPLQV